jgi:hypothetical protein
MISTLATLLWNSSSTLHNEIKVKLESNYALHHFGWDMSHL